MSDHTNQRILLVDDNRSIHEDFKKVLGATGAGQQDGALDDLEAALFDDEPAADADPAVATDFELDSAFQGQEALEKVQAAVEAGRPYAMAFVDVRMPPGWDGIETIGHLWKADPDLQVVICTAFSDYSWQDMIGKLGQSDRLLILKKPFDAIEVCQLAAALTAKWNVTLRERQRLEEVRMAEQEARAYAASLETVNRALETSVATAEASSKAKSEFLMRMTHQVLEPLTDVLARAEQAGVTAGNEDWMCQVEGLCAEGGELRTYLHRVADLAELEAGELETSEASCDPRAIVREVVDSFAERCRTKQIGITVECSTAVPARIRSDPARIEQILRNLVDNAVRSTEQGSVSVVLSMPEADVWNGASLRFEVADTGCGIERERLGNLFEPFHAGEPSVGLSLGRRLAQRLGGDLSVESSPGKGSHVTLTVSTGALADVEMVGPGPL